MADALIHDTTRLVAVQSATDALIASGEYADADWPKALAAAMSANLGRPAMSGADPLTECLAEQCLCFARPPASGPSIIPVGFTARWWMAFKSWF